MYKSHDSQFHYPIKGQWDIDFHEYTNYSTRHTEQFFFGLFKNDISTTVYE